MLAELRAAAAAYRDARAALLRCVGSLAYPERCIAHFDGYWEAGWTLWLARRDVRRQREEQQ